MKAPVRVAVTGAAGQIGYALLFRIASGSMLGPDQPVILHLLEITPALPALEGVIMELNDCAFPTLAGTVATDDPNVAFKDVDFALLVGARPRGPGMERKDLLEANAAIFSDSWCLAEITMIGTWLESLIVWMTALPSMSRSRARRWRARSGGYVAGRRAGVITD